MITCTSTLAAGVNLPARRVILHGGRIARDPLTRRKYLQMIGRAGRVWLTLHVIFLTLSCVLQAGLETFGESFLCLEQKDVKLADLLVGKPAENVVSTLPLAKQDDLANTLQRLVSDGVWYVFPLHLCRPLTSIVVATLRRHQT